ncbi:MAG: DNA-directed RNA polymerase subunit alpha [Candidatus Woesebacteria bacterium GW2011_GWA1_37_8]|uniref:DNA-directed RNA polymerase subunit alpha n=2 Tax=Candidatus Woeseibacteriota TaxID=1752722 RepID=A0A0G0PEJ2_9BACT|nr:MAG: DNA-directed RNA polymerase subunit alpha [Microgenomates group bacterium GW2011_GWC1_37_12b]KKQ45859.1 MAG: DNA-directed RNA polymerase subunit alpha [Candidatus Woesebacteria bacterium GW2011_GWA1_37_8]KKQ87691.1 MAG: DNA-directed RNA polymerase subunit alpha [Candidatus Woesebacteria bacterium GW2011_GWB1_38_8b]
MNEPIFEIQQLEENGSYAKLVISPLARGYGQTLGNALRRVLLESLGGAAITSAKVAGVKHQFSTLKGMREDVVDFLLNLKKVRIKYEGEKSVKGTISAKGPREVKAGDIQTDATVTIANPDLVLATLAKDAKLEARLDIEYGYGYSPAEDRKTDEIGLITLDAAYSPIVRVNYKIEETRVGRLTDFDKLILEIWTDGTILPKDALAKAAEIVIAYFKQIVSPKKVVKEEVAKVDELGAVGKLSVEEIGLPTRVANALIKAGHETVEDLVKAKRDELVKVRNLGEKSVKIIEAALGEKDLAITG